MTPPGSGVSRARGRRTALTMLAVGGALTAAAAAQPWVRLEADDGLTVSSAAATGTALAPTSLAAGVVALAGVPALLAVRSWGRRLVAVAVLVLAAAALVEVAGTARDLQARARTWWSVEVSALADSATAMATPWATVIVLGLLLVLTGAVIVLVAGSGWPGLSARYEGSGASGEKPAASTGSDLWQALDRGHDPTDDEPPGP